MIVFDWPWVAALLPLPFIVRRFLRPVENVDEAALHVPFLSAFKTASDKRRDAASHLLWLAAFAWCLLIVAGMRPQWLGDFVTVPQTGRDLMLAVDLSASMKEQDFILKGRRVDRLTATKGVAGTFIERRIGDRLGLILFGEQAYLQTPLTFDRATVNTLLSEAVIGLTGQKTAIGDAIGLAIKRLREVDGQGRILILLTDGANTAGAVDPLAAADLAVREGIKIYTVGIGADQMIINSIFGSRRINPSAELDEKTLKAIAEKTGGQYFRAHDTDELQGIYQLLDQLEPVARDAQRFRPRTALFYWPLAMALIVMSIVMLLQGKA